MTLEWSDVDERAGIIRVNKSYCRKSKVPKSPKNGEWRNVDISPQLKILLQELRVTRGREKHVLPRLQTWFYGQAAMVFRAYLNEMGIDARVKFHTLRACFATHLLAMGVPQAKVMSMGGWKDLKTFQIYLRLAGVDVKGVTADFNILPGPEVMGKVISLHAQS